MVDIGTVFTGGTFKAEDVADDEPVLTIAKIEVKHFEDGDKLNIHFTGEDKTLICNKTNATKIAKAFGKDTDGWVGKKIQLYNDENVSYGGKMTGGIRVRTGKKPKPAPEPEFDDSVSDIGETF